MTRNSNLDAQYMALALRLAAKGRYSTPPNPCIGCVIVSRTGDVVAQAWHVRAGEPHAEVLALRQAGEAAREATVYVNLEPCCHQGRTPPCAGFLVDAGVARVVTALEDPNPQVVGGGIEYLRGAGVEVDVGLMRDPALELNIGFIHRMRTGRPWVRLKVAASLDGRVALASGESKWITGAAARQDVHRYRGRSSAVMTGSGTVLADDPELTARGNDAFSRQPLRVVLDSALRLDPSAKVFNGAAETIVISATEDSARVAQYDAHGVEVVPLPGPDGKVDLGALLDHLANREVNELLVEAGPTLGAALLEQQLVDEILVYQAPCLLGSSARGMFHLPPLQSLADRIDLYTADVRLVGTDLKLLLRMPGKH